MTFLVRPEHEELRASVRGFLADAVPESEVRRLADDERGYDPDVWARMSAQLGLPGLIIPEEYGGAGYGHTELGVVFEELGRALAPSPLFGSVALAANLLLCCDDEQARRDHLPGIASGETLATVALAEPPGAAGAATGGWDADAVACAAEPVPGGGWRLTGEKTYVVDGHVADVLFVVARASSGISVFAVPADAEGLTRTPLTTLDRTRRQARVTFESTPARLIGADGAGWPAVERMRDLAAVALAAEQAGGAARVLEMAVEYAKARVQFGRPIGSFQAIKHMCADLLVEVESLTSAARYAAGAADTGDPALAEVASLAAVAGADGFVKVAADNIQIHGGIGFTWEHPAHLYLRRARTDAWLLGGPAYHRERYLALTDIAKVPVAAAAEEDAVDDGEVAREVREWLAANFDPDLPHEEWIARVVESGWAAPRWPKEWYGKDLSDADARVVEREFRAAGVPGAGQDRHNLWANTVLAYGSDDMKRRFIGPLLRGELNMCLLYSEPGAGSDLAGLRTRADRDGERWVVNGQKVWTSGAATADYGMLVARTNWDVPKHRGISFFFFPMKQPGVEVRPLHQITGESHFNEVFITDAEVPDANRLGEVDAGWRVLQTALAYERSVMGDQARAGRSAGAGGTSHDVSRGGESDLMDLAREVGRADDPVLRQRIAYVYGLRTLNRWNARRAKAELTRGTSSSIMSVGKLAMSRILHEAARVRTEIIGAETMLDGPDNPRADETNFLAFNAYFTSIGGGTDQIQRNIIAERILGLPKEPEVDRDIPFREVPGN